MVTELEAAKKTADADRRYASRQELAVAHARMTALESRMQTLEERFDESGMAKILEVSQLMIVALCLLAALHTLSDAIATRRRVVKGQINPVVLAWSWNNIRSKAAAVAVESLLLWMKVDRTYLLISGYSPPLYFRWNYFGVACTMVAALSALIVWKNMMSYRRLRDDETV